MWIWVSEKRHLEHFTGNPSVYAGCRQISSKNENEMSEELQPHHVVSVLFLSCSLARKTRGWSAWSEVYGWSAPSLSLSPLGVKPIVASNIISRISWATPDLELTFLGNLAHGLLKCVRVWQSKVVERKTGWSWTVLSSVLTIWTGRSSWSTESKWPS